MNGVEQLYNELNEPSEQLIDDIRHLEGDIMILGVGGKMGPDLAKLAMKAIRKAGVNKNVTGVARFSEQGLQQELESAGIRTIKADLLDDATLARLPQASNVLYLAGTKFGTKGNEAFTWAMNTYLPAQVAKHYAHSRIVSFSTGNVYPLSEVTGGGLTEKHLPGPVGEYGQSCLGRERMFQYFSVQNKTPVLIYRLNYANDVSYGVLLEIARAVFEDRSIDLSMGNVNVIWQGDANEYAIRCLKHCTSPATTLNVTGPEILSVRWLAGCFGELFDKQPVFTGTESPTALLSNASECFRLFGYPKVTIKTMIQLIAAWIQQGGRTANKLTHFQERHGNY